MSEGGSVRLPFVMIGKHGVKRAFTQPCDNGSASASTSPPRSGCRTSSTTRSARSRRPDCPWRQGPGYRYRRFQRRAGGGGMLGVSRLRRRGLRALPAAAARFAWPRSPSASQAACWRWHRRALPRPTLRARLEKNPSFSSGRCRIGDPRRRRGGGRRWRRSKLRRFRCAHQQILGGCASAGARRIDVGRNGAGGARHQRQGSRRRLPKGRCCRRARGRRTPGSCRRRCRY